MICQAIKDKRDNGGILGLIRSGKISSGAGYNPTRKIRKRLFAAAKGVSGSWNDDRGSEEIIQEIKKGRRNSRKLEEGW